MEEHERDLLFVKYATGSLTDDEKAGLQELLDRRPEHRRELEQAQLAWQSVLDPASEIELSTGQDWQHLAHALHLNQSGPEPEPGRISLVVRWGGRIAAAATLLLVVWGLVNNFVVNRTDLIEKQTAVGEKQRYVLPDSTVVWLNGQSKLAYAQSFEGTERKVYLSGEAFFEVKRDTSRPFFIYAGNTITQVLGTAFNLNAAPDEGQVMITVLHGKVSFSSGLQVDRNVILTAGMRGRYVPEIDSVYSERRVDPNVLDWNDNRLIYLNTPLREVIQSLSRAYGATITVADADILDCRFTSTFRDAALEEILEAISLSLDLQYVYKDGRYVLAGKGCSG